MDDTLLFYRLITKDGIKSELIRMDNLTPKISTLCSSSLNITHQNSDLENHPASLNVREYRLKKQQRALIFEYEEE